MSARTGTRLVAVLPSTSVWLTIVAFLAVSIVGGAPALRALDSLARLAGDSAVPLIIAVLAAWPLLGFALAARAHRSARPRLDVGSDGIRLGGRVIAFRDVQRLEYERPPHPVGRVKHYASLVLANGERITLGPAVAFLPLSLLDLDAAYDDIGERTTASRGKRPPPLAEELVHDSSTEAWLEKARSLGTTGAFRDSAAPRVELLAVAEHPAADPTARAAAALALRNEIGEPELARLRVAAAATAAPKLRVVLEAAADESTSDEELAKLAARVEPRRELGSV